MPGKRSRASEAEEPMMLDDEPKRSSPPQRKKCRKGCSADETLARLALGLGQRESGDLVARKPRKAAASAVAVRTADPELEKRMALVTASRPAQPGWVTRKPKPTNLLAIRSLRPINPRSDKELWTPTSNTAGWIGPLRRTFNFEALPQFSLKQWDEWAAAHYKYRDYRNRCGALPERRLMVEFFRPFHPNPEGFMDRRYPRFREMATQGVKNLTDDLKHARRLVAKAIEDKNKTLAEVKKSWAARKFFAKVLREKSPAALEQVSDLALAFIVVFARNNWSDEGDHFSKKVRKFAYTG